MKKWKKVVSPTLQTELDRLMNGNEDELQRRENALLAMNYVLKFPFGDKKI